MAIPQTWALIGSFFRGIKPWGNILGVQVQW